MALKTLEGFDDGLAAERSYAVADGVLSASYGKDGKGMRVGDVVGDTFAVYVDYAYEDTNTVGFNLKAITLDVDQVLFGTVGYSPTGAFYSYGSLIVFLDTNNRLGIEDLTGTTYTADNVFYTGAWYYMELTWTIDTSTPGTGSWELRIDGVTVASATSRDVYHGTYNPKWFRIGGSSLTDMRESYIDNFYQTDDSGSANTGFLGIITVETLLPDGNGNSSDLLGSDSNSTDNYLLVDNNAAIPPATTEYVGSATEGDKDTYTFDDLAGTDDVLGVVTSTYNQKTESGAKFLRHVVRSGSTDYPGTSITLSNSLWTVGDEIWDVDPDTSAQWAYTAVNAMEVGQEVRDS